MRRIQNYSLVLLAVPLLAVAILVAPFVLVSLGKYPTVERHPTIKLDISQKLSPEFWFGNLDDPEPPMDYLPPDPLRKAKWYWRNPLHNFTFYVMGIADADFERTGRYPDFNFAPEDGWNWAVCKKGWLQLPFI